MTYDDVGAGTLQSFEMLANYCTRKVYLLALTLLSTLPTNVLGAAATPATPAPLNWTWGPLFGRACSGFGCTAVAGGVVTVGGSYWTSGDEAKPEKKWVADARWLGPGAHGWTSLPDYPTPIGQVLAAAVGEKVFAIGGRNDRQAFSHTYWLTPEHPDSGWQRGPDLPRPLTALTGGVAGSVIYVLSDPYATVESRGVDEPHAAEPPVILAWDTADKNASWNQVAAVPEPEIGYATTAVADGRLFLFGGAELAGADALHLRDSVWILDLADGEWTEGARLPVALRDSSAVTLDDRFILLAGGVEEVASGAQTADGKSRIILTGRCLAYDAAFDRFTAVEPLRLAVADHGLAARGSELLVIAGEDSPYRTRTDLIQRGNWGLLRRALIEARDVD